MDEITPEDFGRRFAETAMPIIGEEIRRILQEWSDGQRATALPPLVATPAPPTPTDWRGGSPTDSQIKSMTDASATDRILQAVESINTLVGSIATGGTGGT